MRLRLLHYVQHSRKDCIYPLRSVDLDVSPLTSKLYHCLELCETNIFRSDVFVAAS